MGVGANICGMSANGKLPVCKNKRCGAKFMKRFPLQRACCWECESEIVKAKKSRKNEREQAGLHKIEGFGTEGGEPLAKEERASYAGRGREVEKGPVGIRKTAIRKRSKKQEEELMALAEIKRRMIAEFGEKCMSCGRVGPVDLSHIIKRQMKKFVLDQRNLVLQGSEHSGTCRCHDYWEDRNFGEVVKFLNFDEILARLRSMDEGKFWRFVHRFEKHGFKVDMVITNV